MMKPKTDRSRGDELLDAFGTIFKRLLLGAAKCFAATAIVGPAHADVDLALGGLLRTYPLSGVAEVEIGRGFSLWGTPRGPFAGYVRPRVIGGSALSYNAVDGAVEIFPLGILGVRAGGEGVQNDARYTPYDCDRYRCQGRYYRTYFESELSLGFGPLFAQARYRRERWTARDWDPAWFIDPTSGVALAAEGDSQTVVYGVLGLKLNERWALMGLVRYAESANRQISRTPTLMLRYRTGALTIGAGAGTFESTLKRMEATAQMYARWEIWPSLGLR